MKKSIYILLLLFITLNVKSQTIEVIGSLLDSISKLKLSFGNVLLKNDNDSIITSVLTDEKGEFKIKKLSYKKGMYLLTNYVGYDDKRIDILFNNKTKIDVGNIYVKQNITLMKEVIVDRNVKYMEQKFDRKVFNISEAKTAAARTILDLLRTLPGVVVDEEGNVRYKGANATIYVDDQPFEYVYPKIEMVPVDKVAKIELIDVAMRSGGSGRGGIINIKLKSTNTDGISSMVSTNLSTIEFKNIDNSKEFLNINYKKEKITLFNNFYNRNDKQIVQHKTEQNINTFQFPIKQNNILSYDFINQLYYDFIGGIYNPSQKTRLFIGTGFFNFNYKCPFNDVFYEKNNINNEILNNYSNIKNSKFIQINKGIRFSLKHNFDTNDTYIRIFGGYQLDNQDNPENVSYNYHIINSIKTDSIYRYMDEKNNISKKIFCDVFYNHFISDNTRWNLSYDLSIEIEDSLIKKHYIFDKLYLPQSQFDYDINQQHDLSYRFGTTLKKWKLDGGINLKDKLIKGSYTRFDTNNKNIIIPINKNYFKILPSATIVFAINDTSEVKLTLSQTTNFPYFYQLSDYIDKYNPYYWGSGNSLLKPVDFYSVYLGYSYNKEKWTASAEGFFNYTNNEVAEVSIPLTSLLVLSKSENIAKQTNTGVDLSLWLQVNSKFNFSLSSSIFHTYYDTKALINIATHYNLPLNNLIRKQFGYNVKYNMEYKIKEFYTMFYVNYYAKELTYNGYNKAYINSSFNISKKFFNNKLRITLGMNNILDDLVEHGSYSNNFGITSDTEITDSNHKRLYSFSVQYNFRQGDRGTKNLKIGE
ncbi:MAG: TonB-dependent receptor [Bacteroidota bacterium]